jgi:hypothetical protein
VSRLPKTIVRPKKKSKLLPKVTILRYETVDQATLNHYYKNPRIGNVEKVAESLAENGQFKPIVVNVGTITGRPREVLAGNHTLKAFRKLKWKQIEVAWVDVDNAKARQIVLADNGSTDDATYDDSVLTELLAQQKEELGTLVGTTYDDGVLSRLVKQTTDDPNSAIDTIEDAPDDMHGVADLANGIVFESDLAYDMPPLLKNMCLDKPLTPLEAWAGHELDGKDVRDDYDDMWWFAMWHAGSRGINWPRAIPYFYTDDFHFEPIYNDPARNTKKILNLGIKTCVMPNYTIYKEMPIALWVYSAYRSFYIARYWQEAGLKVIPDIQTGGCDEALDLTLLGIPQGVGVVSAQCQMARGDKSFIRQEARLLKEAEDRLGFKNIIVYGHTDADEVVERAGFSANVIRVAARTARRREYLNSGSTINSQKISQKKKKRKVVKK